MLRESIDRFCAGENIVEVEPIAGQLQVLDGFGEALAYGTGETVLMLGVVAYVAIRNVVGFSSQRARRIALPGR